MFRRRSSTNTVATKSPSVVKPISFALPRGTAADHSPTIVNETEYPIVVFLERGTLYNAQVLHPGECVSMTRQQTGGAPLLPYKVHAMIGDETSLPKTSDSLKNLAKVSVIPAAFVAGLLATAMSAGTLAGPSAALTPLVSGMVVRGVVIDSAALVAGSVMASRAQLVTELLLRKKKDVFLAVSPNFRPGQRHLRVTGGLDNGPVTIREIRRGEVAKIKVAAIKAPMSIIGGHLEANKVVEDEKVAKPPPQQNIEEDVTEKSISKHPKSPTIALSPYPPPTQTGKSQIWRRTSETQSHSQSKQKTLIPVTIA